MSIPLLIGIGGWVVFIGFLAWLFFKSERPRCPECRRRMERAVVNHGAEGAEAVWSCPRGHTEIAPPDDQG